MTTSEEFDEWMVFLDIQETELFQKQDYYLAQLCAEVRRSWVKDKAKVKLKDFLIKFTMKKDPKVKSEENVETKLSRSKSFWLGCLGLKKKE